jgi:RNA polymerase sigma-70 factor (ECF subfamily)
MQAVVLKPEFGGRTPAVPKDEAARLVAQAVQGDLKAFEALYRSHVGRVYALCMRMLADHDGADECTQTTFVKAWENLARFEQRASFSTWLHRIAVNEVLGRQRKGSRLRRHLEPVEDLDIHADPTPENPGMSMDLDQAIGALPEGARNVMVLHEIHGYSHMEIGQMLGVAEGTCKAQLHRARRLLRQRLSE